MHLLPFFPAIRNNTLVQIKATKEYKNRSDMEWSGGRLCLESYDPFLYREFYKFRFRPEGEFVAYVRVMGNGGLYTDTENGSHLFMRISFGDEL